MLKKISILSSLFLCAILPLSAADYFSSDPSDDNDHTAEQSEPAMDMKTLDSRTKTKLIDAARNAQELAYAPYSNYFVGASVLTESGKIISGANVENASYGLTVCAERIAIFRALMEAKGQIEAIAVVTKNGGAPCGACRQVMNEFNPNMWVLIADPRGELLQETTLSKLLPHAFGPKQLNKSPTVR